MLAVYDLLCKPGLEPKKVSRIKAVARELLGALKAEKLRLDRLRDKQATRDAVPVAIHNFLYDERTGEPPDHFTDKDVETLAEEVFRHVFVRHPDGVSARSH